MAAPRLGKRAVEVDFRLRDRLAEQCPRHRADAGRAAVWELDGPTITGPRMSKMSICLSSCSQYAALFRHYNKFPGEKQPARGVYIHL